MNTDEALVKLGETTAESVFGVLCSLCADSVERGQVAVIAAAAPLESIAYPVVATDVAYTDGVSGGNLFAITRLGARRLAAAMMFAQPPEQDDGRELDELEMSALGEAMNQMMAASAGALANALGYPVDISVPTTRALASAQDADGAYPQTPYATSVSFTVLGESCRLIQLIPNAFVVRIARALDSEPGERELGQREGGREHVGRERAPREQALDARLTSMLWDVPVRVAAELGRATLSLEQVADPRPGAVIELDRSSGDPVDLCVNGQRFATGELFLINQTEWAIRIVRVLDVNPTDYVSQTERS